jgi:hypothetical protein
MKVARPATCGGWRSAFAAGDASPGNLPEFPSGIERGFCGFLENRNRLFVDAIHAVGAKACFSTTKGTKHTKG